MSALLQTVAGPLSVADVRGPVLAHEHLALDLTRGAGSAATLTPGHRAAITEELVALREEFGLALVVELTCRGMGRDVAATARIAADSSVAVVAATGWYYEPVRPAELTRTSPEQLARTLVGEIERGCGGSGIRPGVIGEVGSHGELPGEAEAGALRAAALAATATGLSVATHARFGRGGLAQLELLTAAGLPPHRVSIGHQDLLDDPAVHRELAASGAYVAFDTVGREGYRSDRVRLRLLLALLESGFADRVLLSCDVWRHGYLVSEGGMGYGHLFRSFLPRLRAAGVDEETIDGLTRRNPLRFLTGADGASGAREAEGRAPAGGGAPVGGSGR
ncbi:phosphotriesterase family protein [Streptomyces kronopolitis]|uniref:phosphotriesterase family protein n=1 Tax=Streptomyces kronopolitis TaxID=1612435 RepID=UPI0020BFE5F5|nr:phosphotriesterase [Streptomyces kronopolitis]MCL6300342.1 phosphotriesterase [Streptomyces kronopolitis]